jgi:hypothetical protein
MTSGSGGICNAGSMSAGTENNQFSLHRQGAS